MKAIISPITSHANRIYSHRTGWGRMWGKKMNIPLGFKVDYSNYDEVYFDHGMEFNSKSKGVNVFLKDEKSWDKLAEKAEMIQNFKGQLYSLDIDCPDYGERLKSRLKEHSSDRYKNLDFDKISEVCKNATTIKMDYYKSSSITLGDSHSLSAWKENSYLLRNDGMTLYGALKIGFNNLLDTYKYSDIETLRLYFGNIDIRHHVCRIGQDELSQREIIEDLCSRYIIEAVNTKWKFKIQNLEIVELLPIENESRKLPKTGYYKGRPFWGSWEERNRAMEDFNSMLELLCEANKIKLIKWPEYFKNFDKELDFEYMEKPRSVHLSPQHYLWKI